jgi:hypothetical protein
MLILGLFEHSLKNSANARQVNDIIELYKLERNTQPD